MPKTSIDESRYPISTNGNGNGSYLYSMPIVNPDSVDEDEDSIDLRQLVSVVKHRLRLILLVAAGITTASALLTFTQEPKYEGSFQILVEPLTKKTGDNPLAAISGDWSGGLDYETQIEVLESPSVLDPIVQKLAVRYPDLEYESFITLGKSPLTIEQLQDTKILQISYIDPDPEKIQFVIDSLAEAYLAYSLDERRAGVNQSIEFVKKQLPSVQNKVDELQEKLQTFRQQYNFLDPGAQSTLLAQKQATFEEKYFDTQVKLNETKTSYNILQNQLGKAPRQAIATSYLSESPRYQKLLNDLQAIEIDLANESTRFSAENPIILDLEDKKSKLLVLLEQEANRLLGNSLSSAVDYSASPGSTSSLRAELDSKYIEAANTLEVLEIRESALASAIDKLNKDIEQMPILIRQYTDLQREVAVATRSLDRFLEAQATLQLQASQQALPWQTISSPEVTEEPISPNIPRNLALGVIGGLLMGMGAALLAERLDPVFHSSEEIKESVNLPILGLIPTQKDLKPQIASSKGQLTLPQLQIGGSTLELAQSSSPPVSKQENKNRRYNASPFLESFRSLNTNISLLGSDSPLNSIVISSSIPSEGKSTISSHLAQASSAMGQRVLLIDADLRRPQVHRWTGLKNDKGLSNILATGLDVEAAIQKVTQWENLSVITAGDIPPDPTRLLASVRMQELMDRLLQSHDYDLIIYDTPPILGFADGRILASRTNGVVLVVRIGKTDRSLLKQNIDNLRVANVPVLGLVANQTNPNADGGYHYYTRYYAERT